MPGLLAVVVGLSAACGGGAHGLPAPQLSPTQRRLEAQLAVDVARIRRAAAPVHTLTLMGTPALMAAVSRFLDDEDRSPLSITRRNYWITQAAAVAAPVCGQCFQQLEAARPAAGAMKSHS
jgi:hypothetical protein